MRRDASDDTIGIGPAPPETVALWVKLVATMGPDQLLIKLRAAVTGVRPPT